MESRRYREFSALRDEFRERVDEWSLAVPELQNYQEKLRKARGYDDYKVETPVVYNRALDDIGPQSRPLWILIADNPGKNEQKAANLRYLVGQSGRLAEGFFRRELGQDFRTDVVIINKTPVHTPKTAELALLRTMDKSGAVERLLTESQGWMALFARKLHKALGVPVWISGRSELKPKGIFAPWFDEFSRLYRSAPETARDEVLVFNHFSMNQFAIELKKKRDPRAPLADELRRIGTENRKAIFGF
jgi:hypothetical protein